MSNQINCGTSLGYQGTTDATEGKPLQSTLSLVHFIKETMGKRSVMFAEVDSNNNSLPGMKENQTCAMKNDMKNGRTGEVVELATVDEIDEEAYDSNYENQNEDRTEDRIGNNENHENHDYETDETVDSPYSIDSNDSNSTDSPNSQAYLDSHYTQYLNHSHRSHRSHHSHHFRMNANYPSRSNSDRNHVLRNHVDQKSRNDNDDQNILFDTPRIVNKPQRTFFQSIMEVLISLYHS